MAMVGRVQRGLCPSREASSGLLVVVYSRSHVLMDVGWGIALLVNIDGRLGDRLYGGHCVGGNFKRVCNVRHHTLTMGKQFYSRSRALCTQGQGIMYTGSQFPL